MVRLSIQQRPDSTGPKDQTGHMTRAEILMVGQDAHRVAAQAATATGNGSRVHLVPTVIFALRHHSGYVILCDLSLWVNAAIVYLDGHVLWAK